MNNYLRHFLICFIIIFSLLLVYFPATQGHYVFGEDYAGLWTSKWHLLNSKSFLEFLHDSVFEGRPLKVLHNYLIFHKYINILKTIEAANTIRLINIISLAFLAGVLYFIFKINKFKTFHSILLSILICVFPPFQLAIVRVCCSARIYSAFFSALAALILFMTIFKATRKITNSVIAIISAIILLQISLNFSQSPAMIFWPLLLVPLIKQEETNSIKQWRVPLLIFFSTGFISILFYHLTMKILIHFINLPIVTYTRRGSLVNFHELPSRIIDFINYPFYTALNLWNIFPNRMIGLSVGIIVLVGMLYSYRGELFNKTRRKNIFNVIFIYSLIMIIVSLSFLPNIVITDRFNLMITKFRVLIGLETTVLLLFYWALFVNIPALSHNLFKLPSNLNNKIVTTGLIILTIIAVFTANKNINRFVNLHTSELEYVKKTIQDYGIARLSKDSKIYIIPSDWEYTDYRSAFTYLSSMSRGNATNMTYFALYELGVETDISLIFHEGSSELPQQNKDTLIIDMREYQKKAYKELNIPLSVKPFF